MKNTIDKSSDASIEAYYNAEKELDYPWKGITFKDTNFGIVYQLNRYMQPMYKNEKGKWV
jgi:hypothetical protein